MPSPAATPRLGYGLKRLWRLTALAGTVILFLAAVAILMVTGPLDGGI